MVKQPAAARLLAIPMGVIALVALIDDLGKFRWFWPYDSAVFSAALLIGVLWFTFFGEKMQAWAKQEQARRDREDESL